MSDRGRAEGVMGERLTSLYARLTYGPPVLCSSRSFAPPFSHTRLVMFGPFLSLLPSIPSA